MHGTSCPGRASATKKAWQSSGDHGFSLIELIVVISIIGILAAIAIPIFANVEERVNDAAGQVAAANGARSAATMIAEDPASVLASGGAPTAFAELARGNVSSVTVTKYDGSNISSLCVTAVYTGGRDVLATSGPGCP